jgi:hypothetical protein
MNRYTIEINPGTGDEPYYLELCAIDEAMVGRYMDDAAMRAYTGASARWRSVFVFPWFPTEN